MTKTSCSSKSTVVLCKTEATTAFSKRTCYLTQFSNFWGRPDWYWCSRVFISIARFFIIAKICIDFSAQSSYASMPLVQTKTQRLQNPETSPSTCPRSLSPARQHCSTSYWPLLHSVTRLGICQKIYTTLFSSEIILHTEYASIETIFASNKQRKCIIISNLAQFWLKLNKMCKFFNSYEESLH